MRHRPNRLGGAVLATVLGVLGAGSIAGPTTAQAGTPRGEPTARLAERASRAHFEQGQRLYEDGKYGDALVEFEAGYGAVPLPGFLINIGQCRRRLGDITAARAAYEQFLSRAPDSPLAPDVKRLVRELALTPPPLVVAHADPVPPVRELSSGSAPAAPPALVAAPVEPAEASPVVAIAVERVPEEPAPPSSRARRQWSGRWWLVWGGLALVTVATSALVISSASAGTTTTIHDGTLGTLRR